MMHIRITQNACEKAYILGPMYHILKQVGVGSRDLQFSVSAFNKCLSYIRKLDIYCSKDVKEGRVELFVVSCCYECQCGTRYLIPLIITDFQNLKGPTYSSIYGKYKACRHVVTWSRNPYFFIISLFHCVSLMAFPHKLPKWDNKPFTQR